MIRNDPIDVISLCDAEGGIKPLRFRIQDENQESMRVDVEEVVSVKPITIVGIEAQVFLCRCTIRHKTRMFELKYTIRSHRWSLMRVVF